MMKDFNIQVNRTEKKCGPRKTRMTCHGWDTSIHIGATITGQEGRDGLGTYTAAVHCLYKGSTMNIQHAGGAH